MKIHFIGIGGIGISGLAKYLHAQGAEISGSDISEGNATKYLKSHGVTITIPHNANCITNQDLIIHSAIIKPVMLKCKKLTKKALKCFHAKKP